MCWKKEYKCYKGKESEECCQNRVDEAVAHRTYIIIMVIAVGLLIMTLTIKTVSDTVFVAQVSFASTITSIVLSAIAIWMSITGERSTNEIKTRIMDVTDRLSKTTSDAEGTNEKFKIISDKQMEGFQEITERMNEVLEKMDTINTNTSYIKDYLGGSNEQLSVEKKIVLNESDAINYLSSVREYFHGPNGKYMLDRVIEYFLDNNKVDAEFHRYMQECMEKTKGSKISNNEIELIYTGMAICLNSLTYNEKTKKKIREMTKETQR